ncbi:unnamed protein product [Brassica oleracea var. botrytis]
MLDLNLGTFSYYQEDHDRRVPLISTAGEEESNLSLSSSSSTDSATDKPFITFGILKRDGDVVPLKEAEGLFPVVDARRNIEFSGDDRHWLNLSSLHRSNQQMVKKGRRGPRSRSSHYRGVTFYRRTGRWESHIWDCGKQVYLGKYDQSFYRPGRINRVAYDRAAIKFRGLDADINFVVDDYRQNMDKMKNLYKVEFVQTIRRESASFGRGSSKYKGLTLQKCTQFKNHHDQIHLFQNRGWDAAAIKYNELGKGVMKFGSHIKGNAHSDLELSLGISSSSGNTKLTTSDYYKQSSIYLPVMTTMNTLKTVAASSGFPFITMTTSSSSISTCFGP